MTKYFEEIHVSNPFDDEPVLVDVEYETCLHNGEIFCVTDMILISKTGVILDKKYFVSEYLEEVEERLLARAILTHGEDNG